MAKLSVDELVTEMENAMQDEWNSRKDTTLPGGISKEDREILFTAISRGLLKFLKDNRTDIRTSEEDAEPIDEEHDHYILWDYQ
jgi:hypothetical protein